MKRKALLLFRAFLRYPLLLISYIIPRNRNKWLFGCRTGFMDNPKYLFLEVSADTSKKAVWIARNREERDRVRGLGLPAYCRYSFMGFYHCLTAGYYAFSHYANDINYWTSGNVRQVMLWHGVGIKAVGLSEDTRLNRFVSPELFPSPKYFLATSPFMAEHFRRYLRIPSGCMIFANYPRNGVFCKSKQEITEFITRYDDRLTEVLKRFPADARLFLYMPTFRETGTDFIADAGFDFVRLNEIMEAQNAFFLLKLHPFTRLNLDEIKRYPRIVYLESNIDIYPLLPLTDTLITDYSSIYYDFILLKGKRVILFPFDYNQYMAKCRDFAYDYDEYTPGVRAYSFKELSELLQEGAGSSTDSEEIVRIREKFWSTDASLYGQLKSSV